MSKRRGRKQSTNDNESPDGSLEKFMPENVVSMRDYLRQKSQGATGGILKQLDQKIKMISAATLKSSTNTAQSLDNNSQSIKKIGDSLGSIDDNVQNLMRDSIKSLGAMRDLNERLDDVYKKIDNRLNNIEKKIKEFEPDSGDMKNMKLPKSDKGGVLSSILSALGMGGIAVGSELSNFFSGDDKDKVSQAPEPPPIPEEHRYTTPDNVVLDKREIKKRVNERVQTQTKPDEQPTREMVEKITDGVVEELKAEIDKSKLAGKKDSASMMQKMMNELKKLSIKIPNAIPGARPGAGGLDMSIKSGGQSTIRNPITPAPSPTAAPDTATEGAPKAWEKNTTRPGQGLLPDMPSVKPGDYSGSTGGGGGGGAAPQAVPQGVGGGNQRSGAAGNMATLNAAMDEMNFTGDSQRAGLAAITMGESGFTSLAEDMRYSAARAREIFKFEPPGGWDNVVAQGEQAIAEAVYGPGSRNGAARGLGNDQPGDGWKYRGRGFIQITGKANYADVGKAIGVDLVSNPDALLDPKVAAKAAVAYMQKRGSPADFESQLKAVGGSSDAYAKKRAAYKKFMEEGTFKPGAGQSNQQSAAASGGAPDATPSGGGAPQAMPSGSAGPSGGTSQGMPQEGAAASQEVPQGGTSSGGSAAQAVPPAAPAPAGSSPQAVPSGSPPPAGSAPQTVPQGSGSATRPPNVRLESNRVDLGNVDQELLNKIYSAAQEYGKPVSINSAFRTDEYQAQLWARWKTGEPNLYMPAKPKNAQKVTVNGQVVDVPGGGSGSPHNSGQAIDLSPGAPNSRNYPTDPTWTAILQKHGLTFPFGGDDPPHVQKTGTSTGGGGGKSGSDSGGQTSSPPGAIPAGSTSSQGVGFGGAMPQAVGTNMPPVTGSRAQMQGPYGSVFGAPGMGPLAGFAGMLPRVNIPQIPGIGGGILGDIAGMATGALTGMVGNAIGGVIGGVISPDRSGGGMFGGGRNMAAPTAPQIPGPPESSGDNIGGILGSLVSMISGMAGSGGAAGNIGSAVEAISQMNANRNVRAPNSEFPTDYYQNNSVPAAMPSSTLLRELFDLNMTPGYNPAGYAFGR